MAVGASKSKLLRRRQRALAKAAASTPAAGSDLGAVEHVVFLMHENRSFDHYFGALGGVNGFDAPSSSFAQAWPGGANSTLRPFHLDTSNSNAECTYDLSHAWQAEHACWNGGAMDSFVSTHVSNTYEGQDYGTLTMGYYDSNDIPFYYELVKNFTVCDNYFCSVLGPTHPNRLMQMSGTLDPAGTHGGPVLVTNSDEALEFTCSWTTMPEVLQAHNVSWKVYNPHGPQYRPRAGNSMLLCKNPLMYFQQYQRARNKHLHRNAFNYYGPNVPSGFVGGDNFSTAGPNDFARDVMKNRLPAVSWVVPPDGFDEHPPAPPALGEWYTAQVLATLMSNPTVWSKTVLFIMYDENDGFFDHVPPPTPPPGTPGEYLTKSPLPHDAFGVQGPIGFGVRVPMMVVSPFSRGGWVNSDVSDHTSQLKFISERWLGGARPPNMSTWRYNTTGDLTGCLPTLATPNVTKPVLPATSSSTNTGVVGQECLGVQINEVNFPRGAYPIPAVQTQPTQGPNTLTPTPT